MRPLFLIIWISLCSGALFAQRVGINSTGAAPDVTSMLDISSTEGGILIPRMTMAERDAIAVTCACTPTTGLLVYQTDNTPGFYYFDGTAWVCIMCSGYNPGFGANLEYNEDEGETTTTSQVTWTQHTNFTTATLPAGDYLVEWNYNNRWTSGTTDSPTESRVMINATQYQHNVCDEGGAWQAWSGFKKITLGAAGTINVIIEHKAQASGFTPVSRVRYARVKVYGM